MTETESSGPDARRAEAIFQPEGGQGEGIAMKDVKLLAQNLRIYGYLLSTSFRQRMAYRAGVWMEILHGGLFVFLQGSLWTALIATGYADASLQEMITYVIINSLVGYLTAFNATSVISQRVDDGSIASDLILPIRFKWKIFFENMGGNLFNFLFSGVLSMVVALLLYRAAGPASAIGLAGFLLSILFGIFISYHILYLFAMSAFWVTKPWYIQTLVIALTRLFGGGVIPIWLYPDWLKTMSDVLPFRFITYEPIQIFLGNIQGVEILHCLMMQWISLIVLVLIEKIIWRKAANRAFVQRG